MNDLETRITKLEAVLGRGNFGTSTVQQRDATFNGRTALVNRASLPATCAVGELAVVNSRLYACSPANSWVGASGYAGKVVSAAAGTPFPSGWTVGHPVTGSYTITHNLGTTNYVPVVTVVGVDTLHAIIASVSTNSFSVSIVTTATDVSTNADFMFLVSF